MRGDLQRERDHDHRRESFVREQHPHGKTQVLKHFTLQIFLDGCSDYLPGAASGLHSLNTFRYACTALNNPIHWNSYDARISQKRDLVEVHTEFGHVA